MRSLSKNQQILMIAALIATLVALYINNGQLNYLISVVLVFTVLLVSISLIMSYRRDSDEERPSGFNSKLAVTIVIFACALISIHLVSVSSEPLFSESTHFSQSLNLADLGVAKAKLLP